MFYYTILLYVCVVNTFNIKLCFINVRFLFFKTAACCSFHTSRGRPRFTCPESTGRWKPEPDVCFCVGCCALLPLVGNPNYLKTLSGVVVTLRFRRLLFSSGPSVRPGVSGERRPLSKDGPRCSRSETHARFVS